VFFSGDGDKIILDLDLGEEMDMIDLCESLSDLLKHPLAEAFLYAKWKSLRLAYLLNYTCYSIFLIFISGFIKCEVTISGYDKSGNNGWCEALYSPGSFIFGYCTTVCGAVYLTVREIIQFWSLRKKYNSLTFDNALDWAVILLVYTYLITIWIDTLIGLICNHNFNFSGNIVGNFEGNFGDNFGGEFWINFGGARLQHPDRQK
jgi:hypothetical protein